MEFNGKNTVLEMERLASIALCVSLRSFVLSDKSLSLFRSVFSVVK